MSRWILLLLRHFTKKHHEKRSSNHQAKPHKSLFFNICPQKQNAPQVVPAIEQYEKMKHLPTGKGRRIAKIPRPFFLTSTAFEDTNAYSEMSCFRKTWNNVPAHIVKYLALLDVKWNLPTSAQADISHLRSKYFTVERFHLPARANFVAYLPYGRYANGDLR